MRSIDLEKEAEINIKKSRFISILIPFNNNMKVNDIINKYKQKYKNASHYTYAFITLDEKKYSDDNEPAMTAGLPILEELEKNQLTNVLCIVIRYYGGIKLGTGGLRRAYKDATVKVIKEATLKKLILSKIIEITFDYEKTNELDEIIKEFEIIEKTYQENVYMKLNIPINFNIEKLKSKTLTFMEKEKAFILK